MPSARFISPSPRYRPKIKRGEPLKRSGSRRGTTSPGSIESPSPSRYNPLKIGEAIRRCIDCITSSSRCFRFDQLTCATAALSQPAQKRLVDRLIDAQSKNADAIELWSQSRKDLVFVAYLSVGDEYQNAIAIFRREGGKNIDSVKESPGHLRAAGGASSSQILDSAKPIAVIRLRERVRESRRRFAHTVKS